MPVSQTSGSRGRSSRECQTPGHLRASPKVDSGRQLTAISDALEAALCQASLLSDGSLSFQRGSVPSLWSRGLSGVEIEGATRGTAIEGRRSAVDSLLPQWLGPVPR